MKDYRIALVIKTAGLQYDDRVRKEILSVQKLFPNIRFKIFVMLPENKTVDGVTDYGVPFKAIYIPARDRYPSATKVLLKSLQFYRAVKPYLESFDAIWVSDIETFFMAALVKKDHLLWDLHELPSAMLSSKLKRVILKYVFRRCKIVVHANPQRIEYLNKLNVINNTSEQFALPFYKIIQISEAVQDDDLNDFIEWKSEDRCVYLQGLNDDGRAAYESIAAVLQKDGLKAVVVGGFDDKIKGRLQRTFGHELNERIKFVGKIPQVKIPFYVKQCYISLVFYKNTGPNNYYCEANRFYQAVVSGVPVVVGNNPSMRELVQKYGFGVSIENDGSDIYAITKGIDDVLSNYDEYRQNIEKYRHIIEWKSQDGVIKEIIEKLFN